MWPWSHFVINGITSVRPSCNLKRSQHDSSCKVRESFLKANLQSTIIRRGSLLEQTPPKLQHINTMEVFFFSHSHNASIEAALYLVILKLVSFQLVVSPSLRTWSSLSMLLLPAGRWEEGKNVADPVGGFCGPNPKRHTSCLPFSIHQKSQPNWTQGRLRHVV